MNARTQDALDYRFVTGLLAGTVLGAGLMLWLAPQTMTELRRRMTDSARALGTRVSDANREVGARMRNAVGDLARKGPSVRDEAVEAVATQRSSS